jgi:hypothetical protein
MRDPMPREPHEINKHYAESAKKEPNYKAQIMLKGDRDVAATQ